MSCHAWRLTPRSVYGADVLAGLLAGAWRQRLDDGLWLILPRTDAVMKILDFWKLSVCAGSSPAEVMVSPFWGALVAHDMPLASGKSMWMKQPGACPLLPMVLYNGLYGPGTADEDYLLPPKSGLLPYLCSAPTRTRRGWDREFLFRAAVRLGVAHVPPDLYHLLERFRRSANVRTPGSSTP